MVGFVDRYIRAPDGLRLHVRDYASAGAKRLTAVCLPGLSRTAEDFHVLAETLASDAAAPRRVIAVDYRGRGLADYDRRPENYTVTVELADVIAIVAALEVAPAIIVGTSRGGLIAMSLAAKQPTAIAGVVLNDIGPVIDIRGLIRIKGYVGKLPQPKNFEEGAEILRRIFSAHFPKLEADDWLAAAKRQWREEKDRLVLTYDPALAKTVADVAPDRPVAPLWPQFEALGQMPVLVIRGANSDILSPETVEEMRTRHPDMDVYEVPDQGHAPLLAEPETMARIATFAAECDAIYA